MPRGRYYQLKRMQLLLSNQSEDCLYLNIYVPSEGNVVKLSSLASRYRRCVAFPLPSPSIGIFQPH